MFNVFSKQAWFQHELISSVVEYLQGAPMSPSLKGWLILFAKSFIGACVEHGAVYGTTGHHLMFIPTVISFFLIGIATYQDSPLPRDVWTDAERLAVQKLKDEEAKTSK